MILGGRKKRGQIPRIAGGALIVDINPEAHIRCHRCVRALVTLLSSVSTMNESALCPRCKKRSIRSVYKENL